VRICQPLQKPHRQEWLCYSVFAAVLQPARFRDAARTQAQQTEQAVENSTYSVILSEAKNLSSIKKNDTDSSLRSE
jgi:hypothetical protein